MDRAKPYAIPKREVWGAYKRVRANQGAAGVDGQTIADFEADLANNLYKLWNTRGARQLLQHEQDRQRDHSRLPFDNVTMPPKALRLSIRYLITTLPSVVAQAIDYQNYPREGVLRDKITQPPVLVVCSRVGTSSMRLKKNSPAGGRASFL